MDNQKSKMRKKRSPKFKVEVVYKEVPDKKDRVRQLWDTLVALPDPKTASGDQKAGQENSH